jgi:hypothetical protein
VPFLQVQIQLTAILDEPLVEVPVSASHFAIPGIGSCSNLGYRGIWCLSAYYNPPEVDYAFGAHGETLSTPMPIGAQPIFPDIDLTPTCFWPLPISTIEIDKYPEASIVLTRPQRWTYSVSATSNNGHLVLVPERYFWQR